MSLLWAYRASLLEMTDCGTSACPGLAAELKAGLTRVDEGLGVIPNLQTVASAKNTLREVLQNWGKKTALHYEQKAGEIRDLLLVMARTAESLGHRDDLYAQQLDLVTKQLDGISRLDDISKIRATVEESATQLKNSVARMTSESRAVIEHLRVEVSTYQSKLEKAEHIAACDPLTGLGSRLWAEARIQQRIGTGLPFSIVMIDITGFRRVNQEYGNLVGDLILKEFAKELRSSCRFTDLVARWGGDEFLVVPDCAGGDLEGQITRLQSWICRPYLVPGRSGHASIRLGASIGIAEYREGDNLQDLLERADAKLCAQQEIARRKLTA
ncbi:GGDEF domain-containing protein [Telmatobacter sp. DSM 110680]|uniref:diguanylate cyclase n=1 Tax=Telmatobacter sp. DSM 110680 TaxID=3036704 RepID=A0AAU7DFT9_9BACT